MQVANQSQALPTWQLRTGQVLRHRPRGAEILRLRCGRLWLTGDGRPEAPAEDVVLEAGQTLHLQPGQTVVLEALRESAFEWA